MQSDRKNDRREPTVSILIPTLNEAGNMEAVLSRIASTIEANGLDAEVLIVDGGSTDETLARVNRWTSERPVRLIRPGGKRGLAADIVAAAATARGEIIVVLDADLSHPPEAIPQLIQPLLDGAEDMVIASRYARGGAMVGWPLMRWLVSRAATMLVSPLVAVKDPLSGFFAARRQLLLGLPSDLSGFKIAFEILVRGGETLRVTEVPIVFHNRASGKSKFGIRQVGIFLLQLIALLGGKVPVGLPARVAAIISFALMLDIVLFHLFIAAQINIVVSQISSFLLAVMSSYGFAAPRFLATFSTTIGISRRQLFDRLALVFCLALLVRNAVFLVVSARWASFAQGAILTAALVSAALLFVGSLAVFLKPEPSNVPRIRWQLITVITVAYLLVLKLVFMGLVNVMPEEAYYWNYAQHLDFGYLDHPPMVAWLIWLSTSLFGDSEFSVRVPAFIAWIIAAVFMFRLTVNLCNRPAAFRSVLLFAVLPIYFGVGFFITPDAPLYAAWAASLYYLERALIAGERRAWFGAGLCLGLGMLAKYTIGLLGLGTLIFILFDRRARGWLLRPQPYFAVLLGALLFSPVLLWNLTNGWASFKFQGANRWSGVPEFSLHFVLLSLLLVLTPIGLLALGKLLLTHNGAGTANSQRRDKAASQYLWLFSFTVVPLLVFVVHSLQNDSKLHWTGPVFLAAIPLLAADMVFRAGETSGSFTRFVRRAWLPMFVVLLLSYGSTFYYFSLGLPGSPMSSARAFGAWRLLAARVGQIEKVVEAKSGSEPIVVGMDKYNIASEISFYDHADRDGSTDAGGPNLFGGRSLMWAYWMPRSAALGRDFLMIDFGKKRLASPELAEHFETVGDVFDETVKKDGRVVAYFHWRVGYGYRDQSAPTAEN
ncbi:MAG: glycosyltransferase family 39 protein [Candidatus Binatia bacterium]